MRKTLSWVLFFAFAMAPVAARAQTLSAGSVPSIISFQGQLDTPVTGAQSMVFRLYNAPTGGSLLWSSSAQGVTVEQGVFVATLTIPVSTLSGSSLKYVELQVAGVIKSPREPLQSVPYALAAKTLEQSVDLGTLGVNFFSSAGGSTLFVSSYGRVGIGTSQPAGTAKLHVSGDLRVGDSMATVVSASGFLDIPGATSTPTAPSGTTARIYYDRNTVPGSLRVALGTSTFVRIATGDGVSAACSPGQVIKGVTISSGLVTGANCAADEGVASGGPWTLSGFNLFPTATTNNVAIGKTTASEKLDVLGNIKASGNVETGGVFKRQGVPGISTPACLEGETLLEPIVSGGIVVAANGCRAAVGIQGDKGADGAPGAPGAPGRDGINGVAGAPGDSHWLRNGLYTYYSQGNVGLGISSPAQKLDVQGGNINVSGAYMRGGVVGQSPSCAAGQVLKGMTVSGGIVTGGTCSPDNAGAAGFWQDNSVGNTVYNSPLSRNVGIGVTSALAKLHVSGGDLRVGDAAAVTISSTYLQLPGLGIPPPVSAGRLYLDGSVVPGNLKAHLGGTGPAKVLTEGTVNTFCPDMVKGVTITGGLVTGVTCGADGGRALEVDGVIGNEVVGAMNSSLTRSAGMPYTLALNTGNSNSWTGTQSFSANTNFPSGVWNTSGNVGVGTLTPSQRLDVQGGNLNVSGVYMRAGAVGQSPACAAGQVLKGMTVSGGIVTGGTCLPDNTGSQAWTENAGANTIYAANTGRNVGIGTAAPTDKLDVRGGRLHVEQSGGGYLELSNGSVENRVYTDVSGNLQLQTGAGYNILTIAPTAPCVMGPCPMPVPQDNVGIGMFPQSGIKLDVAGKVRTSGMLEVASTVKIAGGSPSPGKVLTATDYSGNATWGNPAGGIGATALPCPAGFGAVQSQGRRLGCIQIYENGVDTPENAQQACFLSYGGRLPRYLEWFFSTRYNWYTITNGFSMQQVNDDEEWVEEMSTTGSSLITSTDAFWGTAGGSTGTSFMMWRKLPASPLAYRCFLPN